MKCVKYRKREILSALCGHCGVRCRKSFKLRCKGHVGIAGQRGQSRVPAAEQHTGSAREREQALFSDLGKVPMPRVGAETEKAGFHELSLEQCPIIRSLLSHTKDLRLEGRH